LLTTSNSTSIRRARNSRLIVSRTISAVPTGTVDLSTMVQRRVISRPRSRATSSRCRRSAEPSSPGGVPTAMNSTSVAATASSSATVKRKRPSLTLLAIRASSPGSWIGTSPAFRRAILSASLSTHTTVFPISAKHAPVTSPT